MSTEMDRSFSTGVFTYNGATYLPVVDQHGDPCKGRAGNSKTGDTHICVNAPSCTGVIYVKDTPDNRVKHTIWRLSK